MKKTLIILAVVLFVSCSKDDNKPQAPLTYGVSIEKVCRSTPVTYCITKSTYDYLMTLPVTGDPCNWVSIKDVDGKPIGGYLRSFGMPCNK